MVKKSFLLILSFLFISMFFVSLYLFAKNILIRNRKIPFENNFPFIVNNDQSIYPTRIRIYSINLDLPIEVVEIKDDKWEYSENSVLYVKQSGDLSSEGNKILYGHNFHNLLGNIKNLRDGDLIELYSSNEEYRFSVDSVSIVTPDQTHILSQTEDYRLTIFTCTGFLDSKRLVITANRI